MDTVCATCGAPAKPGIILCEFCEHPVNPEAAQKAIKCKQCSTLNVETAQQCLKCKQWLVVQCLFCNHLTRHDAPACVRCNEPFAGAAERKAARDAQAKQQQYIQMAGAVAPIAGSLLGGVAGAVLGSSWGGGNSYGGSYGGHASFGHSPPSGHGGHHSMGEGFRNEQSFAEQAFGGDDDRQARWGQDSSSSSRGEEKGFFESVVDSFSGDGDGGQSRGDSGGGSERGLLDSVAEAFSDDDDEGGRG